MSLTSRHRSSGPAAGTVEPGCPGRPAPVDTGVAAQPPDVVRGWRRRTTSRVQEDVVEGLVDSDWIDRLLPEWEPKVIFANRIGAELAKLQQRHRYVIAGRLSEDLRWLRSEGNSVGSGRFRSRERRDRDSRSSSNTHVGLFASLIPTWPRYPHWLAIVTPLSIATGSDGYPLRGGPVVSSTAKCRYGSPPLPLRFGEFLAHTAAVPRQQPTRAC